MKIKGKEKKSFKFEKNIRISALLEIVLQILVLGDPIAIAAMYSRCCLIAKSERCFGKKPCCSFLVLSGAYLRALVLLIKEKFKAKWKALA
ncbi:hypothetical protein CFP56_026511 [Quercus suber]|uniref:Uncharacterized protein n=1 Tax=Quercus suber TaxID=58331 RepID=A0AAW0K1Z6_QUESU